MRNQWKTKDQLRKGRQQKQGDASREDREMQTKQYNEDLQMLEKQFARRTKRLEKKRGKFTR